MHTFLSGSDWTPDWTPEEIVQFSSTFTICGQFCQKDIIEKKWESVSYHIYYVTKCPEQVKLQDKYIMGHLKLF